MNPFRSSFISWTLPSLDFLGTLPSSACPIPSEISVSTMNLLVVAILSNLKWDHPVNDSLKRTNTTFSLFKVIKKFLNPIV